MSWSPQQESAIKAVRAWLAEPGAPQVFYLAGYAGTGKTTIAKALAEDAGVVKFAAFTGKAALVLRGKGCAASTIHSLIYKLDDEGDADREPGFKLNPDSEAASSDLIIIDECFVAGTLVDTPSGSVPIEAIRPGQRIQNAYGVDQVVAVARKEAQSIVVVTVGKEKIGCSENHRFFTQRGIVVACDLRPGDTVVPPAEAMRLLRDGYYPEGIAAGEAKVLRAALLDAVVADVPRVQGSGLQRGTRPQVGGREESIPQLRFAGSALADRSDQEAGPDNAARGQGEDQRRAQGKGDTPIGSGRERASHTDPTGSAFSSAGGRLVSGILDPYGNEADSLQNRYSEPRYAGVDRGGWREPLVSQGSESRQTERGVLAWPRVDHVEVLEQGNPRLDQYRDAAGKLYLYDLEARRHSSFSVHGVLVHNCSMVGEELGRDLLSFKRRVLVLGDPAQLPPVSDGTGFFTSRAPDFMLTEIHRQAAENPIIQLATTIRQGGRLELGAYGTSLVIDRKNLGRKMVLGADQVLCGTNKTRRGTNAKIRALMGREGRFVEGERVVSLRNDKEKGLLNGSIWAVEEIELSDAEETQMVVKPLDAGMGRNKIEVKAHHAWLDGREKELPWSIQREFDPFDYAYCLSVHKAQGSQWDDVLIIDESWAFREDRAKHLYTAISRAAERVTVAI